MTRGRAVELRRRADCARSLWERLEQGTSAAAGATPAADVEPRLARWRTVVANGDEPAFERRLQAAGLTLGRAAAALRLAEAPGPPLPWVDEFSDLVAAVHGLRPPDRVRPPDEDAGVRPTPFQHLLLPLARAAGHGLRSRLCSQGLATEVRPFGPLDATAVASLENGLLDRLCRVCAPCLQEEFSRFRPAGHRLLNRLVGATGTGSTTHYDAFVDRWLSRDLVPLLEHYPVLARLVTQVIGDWVTFCAEFAAHACRDAEHLEACFGRALPHAAEGPLITAVRYGLSDHHRGGRCVLKVTFATGLTLAYKPRSLASDEAFARVLAWCRARGLSVDLVHPRTLDRGDHGWMEWVEQDACAGAGAEGRFYRRAGMLLALLHALGGTDCHYENLVAHGEHPILVDLETLMVAGTEDPAGAGVDDRTFWHSVIRTGMLPRWEVQGEPPTAHDISALGGLGPQSTSSPVAVWKNVNTDDMDVYYEPLVLPARANVLTAGGQTVSPSDHVQDTVAGFSEMYRLLLAHREALLGPGGALAAFRGVRVRCVFRPTEQYGAILRRAYAPDCLRNGCDRSIELDHLSRGRVSAPEAARGALVLAAELRALEQLDIPRFEVLADDTSVSCDGLVVNEAAFARDGYAQAVARIAMMSEADLAVQARVIEASLHARRAGGPAGGSRAVRERPVSPRVAEGRGDASTGTASPGTAVVRGIPRSSVLDAAAAIEQELVGTAIDDRDGSVGWIDVSPLGRSGRFQVEPVGDGLHAGRTGIALFLAACDRVRGDSARRDLVRRALGPVRAAVRQGSGAQSAPWPEGLGTAGGVGGIVYALASVADWWQDAELLDDARRLALSVGAAMAADDVDVDVVGGAAGALLGLMKLYRVRPDPRVLAVARSCADRLCRAQLTSGACAGGWPTAIAPRPLTGFSHGASGIACALARLHAVDADARLVDAARAAMAFERTAFVAEAGNWIDFRRPAEAGGVAFGLSWCHGAPGISLARLAWRAELDDLEVDRDLEAALATTGRIEPQDVDHLCCGTFGRIEILLHASAVLEREALASGATAVALAGRWTPGSVRTFPADVPGIARPGFFDGRGGIGYALLRQAVPGRLPCVLAFE